MRSDSGYGSGRDSTRYTPAGAPAARSTTAAESGIAASGIPPLAVVALAGGLGWITARIVPALNFEFNGRSELAATFGLLGVACSVLGVASFRLARTTVSPMTPDATTALVVSGIYRVTRNPMYLGFLLLLLAEMVWLANPVAFLVVPAFVLYLNRFQIGPEEIALRSRFGAEFHSYAAHVRRWI